MLLGGLFLYVSYYGCDQSQVQRMLCTENARETNRALFINGLLRFPLVALYCAVGVGIGVYALNNPGFLGQLPATETGPSEPGGTGLHDVQSSCRCGGSGAGGTFRRRHVIAGFGH